MRRLLVIAATLLLVMVGVWLASKPIARFSLGPGEVLIARPGVDRLLVGDGAGRWTAFTSQARDASEGVDLGPVVGRPAIDDEGSVWFLEGPNLVRWSPAHRTTFGRIPDDWVLLAAPRHWSLIFALELEDGFLAPVHLKPGTTSIPSTNEARGRPISAMGEAGRVAPRIPDGSEVVVSPWSSAFAFIGEDGWEVWSHDTEVTDSLQAWTRVVARDHRKPRAVFAPDGEQLILEGKVKGLWLLSLSDGRLEFMGDGNLGASRRVQNTMDFVRHPAPVLFTGQWTLDRRLHVTSSHLGGGGRYQPKVGLFHDYSPALSWDGGLLVYCQSEFDEQGDAPFDEALYSMDRTKRDQPAVYVDDRTGGRPDQGPLFVGASQAFVYVADGEVRGVAFHRPLQTPP